ncbi:MAG: adenosylcobinamide-GDP ribazoletransferase [Pelodictyon luteolum]|uniref:Adenosylcobinamide-GDP ribazoletransferase n=1 Tax=Pelodictyon luteolum TaxID=1100 RepID=A0A165MEK2_PELLU|nr:adenosylcobinamide-GDP ribazoletransferase [Pelodictyon luteolum]KZK75153.1 MAG: adenosylcobinamide-GDP ribazoletransferase [Pelodictyon luteolum]
MLNGLVTGLVTALRTLSVFPVPGREARSFSSALYWFPAVGLLLGLFVAGSGWIGYLAGWDRFGAALMVVSGLVVTRGMHADGLADMFDGFWGGRDRDSALRIMKDPNVGSFGALGLGSLLLFKWVALEQLLSFGAFDWVIAGVVLARTAQVALAVALPYARSGGGTAEGFVVGAGRKHAVVSSLSALLIIVFVLKSTPGAVVIATGASLASTLFIGWLSSKKIGGVTGDVLGAVSEVTEIAVWTAGGLYFMLR